ncbi:calcium:proton antiporter [Brachybacterium fresconis]|uniref:Ca2+:H+ antiporter n=1 Tax=Brachybacterium fresconis TaxID=173363 RepID=A0ABS4YIN9_9MICO|nr:calcium:proton antiporter [Brachybacterium fresconis]MBP2408638.1 Ca2+:H+ antiporter [Brachybacterium fresconis]
MPSLDRSPALTGRALVAAILTRDVLVRLVLGWASVAALAVLAPDPGASSGPVLLLLLAAIVVVIVVAAGGVVQQAEALAHRLGDPYGTLVLTLSIVVIEVVLIAAVMLGPGEHTTIARDSVMAVSMIILNLALGICLLVAGIRHGDLRPNRVGASTYLVLLVALGALAFALPALIGRGGSFTAVQAVVIVVAAVGLYGFFLWRQAGAQAGDFQEVEVPAGATSSAPSGPDPSTPVATTSSTRADAAPLPPESDPITRVLATHRTELLARTAVLVATVLPIVLLSHHMASLLDEGLARLGAPAALGGVLIAMIVFTPETITAVRAALGGEIQRVVNLCHGALVSTYALTIPTVLVISLLTGQQVVLAESGANLLLLGATLAVSAISVAAERVTAVHGAVHLLLFVLYALALFA